MGLTQQQITENHQELVELLMESGFKCLYGSGRPIWRSLEGKEVTDMQVFCCQSKRELEDVLAKL